MFDLPFDPALQDFITALYSRNDGVVSAVCYGPAAFAHVKQSDGTYLIAGKAVAGFCNEEEQLFGKRWQAEFPFLLEDKLKQRGGLYERAELMLPHVSVAGRLITGQNPYSLVSHPVTSSRCRLMPPVRSKTAKARWLAWSPKTK